MVGGAIGYVVVEWNQASGLPNTDGEFYDDRDEAEEIANIYRRRTANAGRHERYAVGTITLEEQE